MDPALAAVPRKYLLECIKCGVALAMKILGGKTYWGTDVEDSEKAEVKALLGVDKELHTPGDDANKTANR